MSRDVGVLEQKRTKASSTFDKEWTPFLSIEVKYAQFHQPVEKKEEVERNQIEKKRMAKQK